MYARFAAPGLLTLLALTGCPDAQPVPVAPPASAPTDALPPSATATNPDGANPLAATEPDPWPGEYVGEGLELTLEASGAGYSGTVSLNGKSYPLTAAGEGELSGTFQSGKKSFSFTAAQESDTVRFETAGTRYILKRVHSQNPLASGGGPAKPTPAPAPAPLPTAGGPVPIPTQQVSTAGWESKSAGGGLSFLVPRGWSLQPAPRAGVIFAPPNQSSSREGPPELYLLDLIALPAAKTQEDPLVFRLADQRVAALVPFVKRIAVGSGPSRFPALTYRGTSPSGRDVVARAYTRLDKKAVMLMIAIAEPALLRKREPTVQAVFDNSEYETHDDDSDGGGAAPQPGRVAGNINRALIGQWRRTTFTGGFVSDIFIRLDGSGDAYYSQTMIGGTSGGSVRSSSGTPDHGRWRATGTHLRVDWDDGTYLDDDFSLQDGKMYLNPKSSKPRRYQRVN